MINDFLYMNGYGSYVWSAFAFTLFNFSVLYILIKIQYIKERNKFISKFGALDTEKAQVARNQNINKQILSRNQSI
tara:strand:+ start:270 stop:497 length:228 start_codon:yes stop_codon:yes gene_type:complete